MEAGVLPDDTPETQTAPSSSSPSHTAQLLSKVAADILSFAQNLSDDLGTEKLIDSRAKWKTRACQARGHVRRVLDERSRLEEEIAKHPGIVEDLKGENVDLRDQLFHLHKELEGVKHQATEAREEAHQAQAARDALRTECAMHQADLQEALASNRRLEAKNETVILSAQRSEKKWEDLLREKAELLERLQVENDSRIEEVTVLRTAWNILREELGQRGEEVDSVQATQEALIRGLARREQLEALVKERDARLLALQREHTDLCERFSEETRTRKALFNRVQELQGNIRVYCRVRPLISAEAEKGTAVAVNFPDENEVEVRSESMARRRYEFNKVYTPATSQAEVFEDIAPLITSVMDGYNVCIFAYGQTGTGKTYTMEGPPEDCGVNMRALKELFRVRNERISEFEYAITCSIVEIYNETLRDLLAEPGTAGEGGRRDIRLGPYGPFVPDLTVICVTSALDVVDVLERGRANRSVGVTNLNEYSSRSHCILQVAVSGCNTVTGEKREATLSLVDLAGSERVSKSEATGDRLREAQFINKSLLSLGDVIAALASKSAHIPYRNSKLTFFLQNSLGGDSKTLMFLQVSPAEMNVGETVCSLNFGQKVSVVQLGPATKNVVISSKFAGDGASNISRLDVPDRPRREIRSRSPPPSPPLAPLIPTTRGARSRSLSPSPRVLPTLSKP